MAPILNVPVIETLKAGSCPPPHRLWPAFADRPGGVFLDTSLPGPHARFSILANEPVCVLRGYTNQGVTLQYKDQPPVRIADPDPIAALRDLLSQRSCQPIPGLPFVGGAIGWLGYEAGTTGEGINAPCGGFSDLPELTFGLYNEALVHDHLTGETHLVARSAAGLERLRRLVDAPPPRLDDYTAQAPRPELSPAAYSAAIARIKAYIAAGDTYQVNFTHRFSTAFEGTAAALHLRLRELNPAAHAACLDFGDHQIVSSSPERLLSVRGRRIETRPIKGTLPRLPDPKEDAAQRDRLLASVKDQAELLMIVDLARNDLGRVARPGSVRVDARHDIESYATVHHLVATVSAELAPGLDRFDALKALHPGGSITGAPKIRSMQIIAELEPVPRQAYTGALGYLGDDGNADLAIAIRTITCAGGLAAYHVGGGITWDSDADAEYQETLAKGRALSRALTAPSS